MATRPSQKRQMHLRLIHDGAQPGTPLDEPLQFGLQDSNADVHPGTAVASGTRRFDLTLDVRAAATGQPTFSGAFVHGPPQARFLYLSWKREAARAALLKAPWGWRIKIPLSGIGWADIQAAEQPDACLAADVTGRRPHRSEAIEWRLETLRDA